jgi:hypothetical protein
MTADGSSGVTVAEPKNLHSTQLLSFKLLAANSPTWDCKLCCWSSLSVAGTRQHMADGGVSGVQGC